MMTYYDYLLNEQKYPWWSRAISGTLNFLISLIATPEDVDNKPLDPFQLTKEQKAIADMVDNRIACDVDSKSLVITIDVNDQDPLICATVADSVKAHLQQAITDYRTRKARVDLEYNQKLFRETKARYDKARQAYAAFADANQDVILESVRSKRADLENEMQIQYNAYTQVAAQLTAASARVQEETPAFTTIQRATVWFPEKPSKLDSLSNLYASLTSGAPLPSSAPLSGHSTKKETSNPSSACKTDHGSNRSNGLRGGRKFRPPSQLTHTISDKSFRVSELINIYHGSVRVVEKPIFGEGKSYNDYGRGFYCTEHLELAKEWACSSGSDGYANHYQLDRTGLRVLNLNKPEYNILNWLTILLENRKFNVADGLPQRAKNYLLENFKVDYKNYDVIIGYRADDSYFSYAGDFVNGTLSLSDLSEAMRLGKLGEQVVLKSKKAFEALTFIEAIKAPHEEYFTKYMKRQGINTGRLLLSQWQRMRFM